MKMPNENRGAGRVAYPARGLMTLGVLAIGVISAAVPSPLPAQRYECALRLQPWSAATGYRLRTDRCEGMYVGLQSGEIVQVVSLVKGGLHYDLQGRPGRVAGDSVLNVHVPRLPGQFGPTVSVRGSARESNLNWALDATLSHGHPLRWNLRDVITPEQLSSDRIGLVGAAEAVSGGRRRRVYIPVEIRRGAAAADAPDSTEVVVKIQSAAEMGWSTRGTDVLHMAQRLNMDGYFRIMLPPTHAAPEEQTINLWWRAREEPQARDIPETILIYRW
jgi:hypothetical protein